MGTRRSRHNKGRKPEYKDHRAGVGVGGAPVDLEMEAFTKYVSTHFPNGPACPACGSKDHYLLKSRKKFKCADCYKQYAPTIDTPFHAHKLSFVKINEIEAMKPCSATELAAKMGLTYKGAWSLKERLAAKSTTWATIVFEAKVSNLAYPFIAKRTTEGDLVMQVNQLVPQSLGYDRSDICQDILLAIIEGKTSIEKLRANRQDIRGFMRQFNKSNREQGGHAASIHSEEWNTDEVHTMIAARNWNMGEMQGVSSAIQSFDHYQRPTQIEDVFEREVEAFSEQLHERGLHWSHSEIEWHLAQERTA